MFSVFRWCISFYFLLEHKQKHATWCLINISENHSMKSIAIFIESSILAAEISTSCVLKIKILCCAVKLVFGGLKQWEGARPVVSPMWGTRGLSATLLWPKWRGSAGRKKREKNSYSFCLSFHQLSIHSSIVPQLVVYKKLIMHLFYSSF